MLARRPLSFALDPAKNSIITMGSIYVVAAVLFIVVMAREGSALECVQCNSFSRPDCDSTPELYERPCPENATSCRKMEQEIYYDDDYQVRTVRQCAIESGPMKCIERTGTYRFKVWYCHCEEDNCNGATSLSVPLILATFSAAVAFMFKL